MTDSNEKIPYFIYGDGDEVFTKLEESNGGAYYVGLYRWSYSWHRDTDVKIVPKSKIIKMRKELQDRLDFLRQFYSSSLKQPPTPPMRTTCPHYACRKTQDIDINKTTHTCPHCKRKFKIKLIAEPIRQSRAKQNNQPTKNTTIPIFNIEIDTL